MQFDLTLLVFLGGLLGFSILGWWKLQRMLNNISVRMAWMERSIWDSAALAGFIGSQDLLPRPGGWAVSTDILYELVRLVQANQPRLVVELGAGLSTLFFAKAVSAYGGRMVSIDHDADYAQQIRRELERHGLQDYVEFRVAPLKEQVLQQKIRIWYDMAIMEDLTEIDLIFVDGPPARIQKDIRQPSLPYFWNKLASGGRLVMDDAARPAEKAIIAEWKAQYRQATFTKLKAEKGAVIIGK